MDEIKKSIKDCDEAIKYCDETIKNCYETRKELDESIKTYNNFFTCDENKHQMDDCTCIKCKIKQLDELKENRKIMIDDLIKMRIEWKKMRDGWETKLELNSFIYAGVDLRK